ncbi:MAG: hypothetical protein ABSD31_13365 [Candidatus Binataceae bacterium]
MDDPFTAFDADFKAQRTPLLNNYRSSPDLVRIQDVLAKALDAKSLMPVSKVDGAIAGDSCAVWDFTSPAREAICLADFVKNQMAEYKLKPRDFSILVRQKAAAYMETLEPHFAAKGLYLRNEAAQIGPIALQELLAEDLSEILVTLLRFLTSERAGRHWTECLETICMLRGLASDDDSGRSRVVRDLNDFGATFKKSYPVPPNNRGSVQALVQELIDFVGRRNLLASSPAYRQGDWLNKVTEAATLHLEASCQTAKNWSDALDKEQGS